MIKTLVLSLTVAFGLSARAQRPPPPPEGDVAPPPIAPEGKKHTPTRGKGVPSPTKKAYPRPPVTPPTPEPTKPDPVQ